MMVSVLFEIVCMTEMLTISSIFTSNILSGLLISRKTRMENINKNSLSKDQLSPTTITKNPEKDQTFQSLAIYLWRFLQNLCLVL